VVVAMDPRSDLLPSRKDQILIYTLLGWVACGIFSIIAYNMAKEDLAMIDSGEMEDRDRSTIDLMKTVGLVHICIMCGTILLMCCVFAMQMSMIGNSSSYGGY
jgi:uncharacterized membrane protein